MKPGRTDVKNILEEKRISHPTSVPGYEPVLRVTIYGEPRKIVDGFDQRFYFEPTEGKNWDIELFGSGNKTYISYDEVVNDRRLQSLLTMELAQGQRLLRHPSVGIPQRRIVDPESGLYEDHVFIRDAPDDEKLLREILLRYVLFHHEIGSDESPGGHFMTLMHPENVVFGYILPFSDIPSILQNNGTFSRAIPTLYHEIPAFLQERTALEALRESGSPFDVLSDVVTIQPDEREALKSTNQDVLDDLIQELITDFISPADPTTVPRDTIVLTIADWLEQQVGRENAIELLDVPRQAVMHPDKWVCHMLHDLENGVDTEEIATNGSYWDTRPGGATYDEAKEDTEQRREDLIDDPDRRAFYSTHETVKIKRDRMVRTWYSYKPDSDYSLSHIRYRILLQELFSTCRKPLDVDGFDEDVYVNLLGDTAMPGQIIKNSSDRNSFFEATYLGGEYTTPFYEAAYQTYARENRIQPGFLYYRAMNGQTSSEKIGGYYRYERDNAVSWKAWKASRDDAMSQLQFDELENLFGWIHGETDDDFVRK